MAGILDLSAAELSAQLKSRALSVREVAQAFADHAASIEPKLRSYITLCDESQWGPEADRAQAMLDSGDAHPLTGVPVAVKDNISTNGLLTTCASQILRDYVPPYDATVVARMRAQGMVITGKTNLDEFAMGGSTERSSFYPTGNPWDVERSPGGSSGGSAACVAGFQAPLSLGSDTGGSIRQPAALCGIVGFKPTYGRVSRYGLVAFGSSLDQIGPFGRNVEDTALLAEAISGHDTYDATSLPQNSISTKELKSGSLKGKRVAVIKELMAENAEPGVLASVREAIEALRREGVEVDEVSVPEVELGVTTYYIIAPAEASSNLARFDGVRYGPRIEGEGHVGGVAATRGELFGHEVKTRIIIGTYVLSAGYYDAFYHRAQQVRGQMAAKFESLFQTYDAVLGPTSPCVAFKLGSLMDDPMALKLVDYCTIPANMGGFPAISIPCGLSEGLPVGLQLMGPVNGDERLLQLAFSTEQALGVRLKPDLGLN